MVPLVGKGKEEEPENVEEMNEDKIVEKNIKRKNKSGKSGREKKLTLRKKKERPKA